MLIKNKIILGFVLLTSVLMVLFSFYIYINYKDYRERVFYDRLMAKILATTEIFDKNDKLSERVITSIPEQSEYVFDESCQQIFSLNPTNDYVFEPAFFKKLNVETPYFFYYTSASNLHEKEGLAIAFRHKGKQKYAVITAYNRNGFEMLHRLKDILVYGNVILVFLIAIAGYLLAFFALRPLNKLVEEIEAINPNNLRIKLTEHARADEVSVVAESFNGLLEKINTLVENRRSFISYASHELRTPLTAISGILETSVKYDSDVEGLKTSSKLASLELNKLIELTNELLQLSKIESIDGQVKFEPVNPIELVMDLMNKYKKLNPLQEFDLFISDGFALESDQITIMGNADLLKIALGNLMDNAIKYSDAKRVFIRFEMNTNEQIKLSVIDAGIGIESAELKKIFEPMSRGSNIGKRNGFGLGLTLTEKIIKIHKGYLRVLSKIQKGTEVQIFLPVKMQD